MKHILSLFIAGLMAGMMVEQAAAQSATPESKEIVVIETSLGTFEAELYRADAPKTVENFVRLAEKKYFNGIIFHRVSKGFVIQGGDPTGTGRGGPGYVISDEFLPTNSNARGTIAMANAGPNTGGSQFFINLVDNNYCSNPCNTCSFFR